MTWGRPSLVSVLLVLSACAPSPQPSAKPAPAPGSREERVAAEFRRDQARFATARVAEGTLRDYDALSYELKGRFDWDKDALVATVTATVRLASPDVTRIELDSRVSEVQTVLLNDAVSPSFDVDPEEGLLTIDLSGLSAAERAADVRVKIAYVRYAGERPDSGDHFDPTALRAVRARKGDPVASRVVNTMSEATGARQWMPCKDEVSDRATFALELTTPGDELAIANGELVRDERLPNGERVMGWKTWYTLPTYLMAFAEGQLTLATTQLGTLPIGVVSRRGLPIDTDGMLSHLTRLITRYQQLIGPYGFEKYYIVLLPEFGGGEEHAGITFQGEGTGPDTQQAADRSMIAHELAHQWFGDFMTVRTWDDLWIKEGMATFMEAESNRPWEDLNGKGRLFGSHMGVSEGDAIIDPALKPDDKYTSGPYGRAGWLLTQLRAALGDDAFFRTLRKVLADHAYGTITTDEFLAYFDAQLSDALMAKVRLALYAKKMPKLAAQLAADGTVALGVKDEEHALVLPVVAAVRKDGGAQLVTLPENGGTVTLDPHEAWITTLDPRDVHPVQSFEAEGTRPALDALRTPKLGAQPERFFALAANEQMQAFSSNEVWLKDAAWLALAETRLASENARARALQKACDDVTTLGAQAGAGWREVIDAQLIDPPYLGLTSWYTDTSVGKCLALATPGLFDTTLARLRANPAKFARSDAELLFLEQLPFPTEVARATWGAVAAGAPSARLRGTAADALLTYLKAAHGDGDRPFPRDAELASWQSLVRGLLTGNHTSQAASTLIQAVTTTKDAQALPALATVVDDVRYASTQKRAVCAARAVAADAAAFEAFAAQFLQREDLPGPVRLALTDAAACE